MNDFAAPALFVPLVTGEPGQWLRARLADGFGQSNTFVPRGFEAYARVFHPLVRTRQVFPGALESLDSESVLVFDEELVTWASSAAQKSVSVGPYARSSEFLPSGIAEHLESWNDDEGGQYGQSVEGNLETETLGYLASHLARHTTIPDAGVAAVWEGWGSGSSARYSSSRPPSSRIGQFLSRMGRHARARDGRSKTNPKRFPATLELPGRVHSLYAASINAFADPSWVDAAPWIDPEIDAQSPNVLWPEDRAWVMVTEVDFDSTIVAGSQELIDELVASGDIEALAVDANVENRIYPILE